MGWFWYGVKTAYRVEASGKPSKKDAAYDPEATLAEERVVLFKARSFDEAISKAEKEALVYESTYTNVYGEEVSCRYVGVCDAFEMPDEPKAGVEVFSSTRLVSRKVSNREVVNDIFGPEETEKQEAARERFMYKEERK
jgi:hypothetical protein